MTTKAQPPMRAEEVERALLREMFAENERLRTALANLLPSKLCGESWNLPAAESIPIRTTVGALAAARAALAAVQPREPDGWRQVLREVAVERGRQISKGYDAAHDDEHEDGLIADEAARAICSYGHSSWISSSRREELIKGIALAVAEVERLDRAAPPVTQP